MVRHQFLLAASLLLAVVFSPLACAGREARDEVLAPAVQAAWGSIVWDVDRGIQAGVDRGELTAEAALGLHETAAQLQDRIEAGIVSSADLVAWRAVLSGWAQVGIDDRVEDGEISSAVAGSLRERLKQFDESLELMSLQAGGGA